MNPQKNDKYSFFDIFSHFNFHYFLFLHISFVCFVGFCFQFYLNVSFKLMIFLFGFAFRYSFLSLNVAYKTRRWQCTHNKIIEQKHISRKINNTHIHICTYKYIYTYIIYNNEIYNIYNTYTRYKHRWIVCVYKLV